MGRQPVTVVILAWNAWASTRDCLESLRPTLGPRDDVVVVDNGSRDATGARLPGYRWVRVVTNESNRGFAAGCNDGARVATNEIVVFLNNDTQLCGRWLDPLVQPFADHVVGATGPRSNFVSGSQLAESASYQSTAEMRRYARQWAIDHRDAVSETDRLVGFCIAVRRSAFEAVGGFDEGYGIGGYEDDDLCRRLRQAGYRLLVAHQSFVHHDGHRTFDVNGLDWAAEEEANRARFLRAHGDEATGAPLVSACLIVKDEEDNIEPCLASLAGFVDEVIVYDTGSTDRTVELAAAAGATVLDGYWDDDFSRARNAALAHCHGEWILWVDADETLVCEDLSALRRHVRASNPHIDGWSVAIDNVTGVGAGAGFTHYACRLFRRARCEWAGRLHEQVARRANHGSIGLEVLEVGRLRHTGYLESVMAAKGKAERNLRLAQAELDAGDGWDEGFSLLNLARSYQTVGRFDEALGLCTRAIETTDNPITRRLALRSGGDILVALRRPNDAREWLGQLREMGGSPLAADVLEASICLTEGRFQRALDLYESLPAEARGEDGFEVVAHALAPQRASALAALGRHGEAADTLLAALVDHQVLDTHLGEVVELLRKAGRSLAEVATAIPVGKEPLFLAQVLQLDPETGDAVLEACLGHLSSDMPVLAAAATLAPRCSIEVALRWSARLRGAGYAASCPLVAIAAGDGEVVYRARAAATAFRAFDDDQARQAFELAIAKATPLEQTAIESDAALLCPELLTAA